MYKETANRDGVLIGLGTTSIVPADLEHVPMTLLVATSQAGGLIFLIPKIESREKFKPMENQQ